MPFGLPVGGEMEGNVLVNAFEQPPTVEGIDSWENVPDPVYDARLRDGVRQRPCGPGHRDAGPGLRAAHQGDERDCLAQPPSTCVVPSASLPCRWMPAPSSRAAWARWPRGALNPLLALVPLFDAGPGIVSPRAELLGTADPKARRQFGGPNHSVLIRQSD